MRFFWKCTCQGWDYDAHHREKREKILLRRCERLLVKMRSGRFPFVERVCDTRPIHRGMFRWMTPWCFPYFAGNYRGDARFKCLTEYRVHVPGDDTVGTQPSMVFNELSVLRHATEKFIEAMEGPQVQAMPAQQQMIYAVQGVSFVLAEFLRIHPYANGNGHMGRFAVWSLLLRLGIVPKKWPMEARPKDPPYSFCLWAYRHGQPQDLWQFMLDCITG